MFLTPPSTDLMCVISTPPPRRFNTDAHVSPMDDSDSTPDGVSPRVLKACSPHLCGDYGPVGLTPRIMKVLDRLVLDFLWPVVKPSLDPLQFAYQPQLGVEDTLIHLVHHFYTHLDKPGGSVRIMFFDFSSAFNKIQPVLLGEKLKNMLVDTKKKKRKTKENGGELQEVQDSCQCSFHKGRGGGSSFGVNILGCPPGHKLDWSVNALSIYRKTKSRLYFLRTVRSFNTCSTMLWMFYESVVASSIFYAVF
ncbi:hypothetical protein EXN66_Car018955 [Channa argus]|uniref:Alkylated DNA repair protein AlkB homologue 8 N-terminal domain-containing protein n=1 Tax=Channa argus TaxID=215402 RepID=A0A6G1QLC0_CHAAH|nr:hypothetical protein EXN66_Car018955 [Channa argus]